jgi:glycosyltransferase involved in cell wall biosynthesis
LTNCVLSIAHQLSDQIKVLGLSRSCLLLGQRTDVVDLHHMFNLFVQSSDYEGTSSAVLEAVAMETPVVATDAGGTAEIVRHGVHGLIVQPGDSRALALAMSSTTICSALNLFFATTTPFQDGF